MEPQDQDSVNEEVAPQDPDSTVVDEQTLEEVQGDSPGQDEDPQDKNWRELRKGKEVAEQKVQQAEEKLKMQEEFIKNLMAQKQQPAPLPEPVEETVQIPQDEYPTFGQSQQSARAIAREEFALLEKKRQEGLFKERLREKFTDFDTIVNPETIAILEKQQPELAATIADSKDSYKMGFQIYSFLKATNPNSADDRRHAKEVVDKIEKNEKSVQTPQAYNKRPMAQAFSMTNMSKDDKNRLYEEMTGFAQQSPGY